MKNEIKNNQTSKKRKRYKERQAELEQRNLRKKRIKKRVLISVGALSISAFVALGGALAHTQIIKILNNKKEKELMNDLIATHISDFNCIISQTIYSSAKYDYEIANGNNIKDAINENDLAITVIGDTYLTNDGSKIAKITAEVEIVDYQEPLTYNTDEYIFYGVPSEYIYEDGKCLKKEEKVITIYTFATENNDYSNLNTDFYKILNILDYEIHDSIKISELDNLILIADIPDQNLTNPEEQEAKLRLINK